MRACAVGLGVLAVSGASQAQAQDAVDGRPFSLTPTLGLEELFTDNAALASGGRRSDVITRGVFRLDGALDGARATGRLSAEVAYDRYARTPGLSGASVAADGSGTYTLLPGVLALEAAGTIVNSRTTTFQASAVDRSGVPGRAQVSTYRIGPQLNVRLGDYADLAAAARFAQVSYAAADASTVGAPLPADDGLGQLIATVDTAGRFPGYELLTTAQYEADTRDFHTASGVQSLYLRVAPRVRLIARGGYDTVRQVGVVAIDAPVASGGVEFTLNPSSKLSVEAGRRYHHDIWAAKADVSLSDRLVLSGSFEEAIQPDQLLVASSFEDYVEQAARLPPPIAPSRFTLTGDVYQQTSFSKTGALRAFYGTPRQSISLTAVVVDRRFLSIPGRDETVSGGVGYRRALSPDLSVSLNGAYARTFESPLYGASDSLGFQGGVAYLLNSSSELRVEGSTAYDRQLAARGRRVRDDTLRVAIQKRL